MLFIKFNINSTLKYAHFEKLYQHMVTVRQPNFMFENQVPPEIDWGNLKEDEFDAVFKELDNYDNPDKFTFKRYLEFIPSYANSFIESHLQYVNKTTTPIKESEAVSIMNYLEYDFEVEMDQLEKSDENLGVVKFSTGNFPFGGLDRFLMVLKAFNLTPTACFNGFSIIGFNWISNFEFETIEFPEKTKKYLSK
ncbi:hypothetical protein ACFQ5N_01940 [Lutibacter holmesii]|uniref:Uncharacterized protein n=1 Tax=Lutibacter holmesii TaxID=1137985 RepID=A0ABW3WJY3_9FLAO